MSTSSDTTAVASPNYSVTAAHPLSGVTVTPSSSLPGASAVVYKVGLKTSASGGLLGSAGSSISIAFPSGTVLTGVTGSQIMVGTTQVGTCGAPSGTSVACGIFNGSAVAASTAVTVTLNGVTNPATAAVDTAAVSTTSDTVKNATYCIVAAGVPCISGVSPASGGVGTAVTITGVNLSGATSVKFHGTSAVIGTDTAKKITTTVPAGATTGTVTVTTGGGTATSSVVFTVT